MCCRTRGGQHVGIRVSVVRSTASQPHLRATLLSAGRVAPERHRMCREYALCIGWSIMGPMDLVDLDVWERAQGFNELVSRAWCRQAGSTLYTISGASSSGGICGKC